MRTHKDAGFATVCWVLLGALTLISVLLLIAIIAIGIGTLRGNLAHFETAWMWLFLFVLPWVIYPAHFILFTLALRKAMGSMRPKWWLMVYMSTGLYVALLAVAAVSPLGVINTAFIVLALLAILMPQIFMLNIGVKQTSGTHFGKRELLLAFFVPIAGSLTLIRSARG